MSVVFGKCNSKGLPVQEHELMTMEKSLNHWQADDSGILFEGVTGLGHLMLLNTPESLKERLPWRDGSAGLAITADARLDNRADICTRLQLSAPAERKLPDSQLILLLYQKYASQCVNYLIGDFAFAIWDDREKKLFCARDHMGVRPFFYCSGSDYFAFASEKKGLLCLPGIDKSLDYEFLYAEVMGPPSQGYDTTIYKYIRRLPPAHTLAYRPSGNELKLSKYWTLDAYKETRFASRQESYDGLRFHFDEAVKCRLRSNYPMGSELSGGLDSSVITGAACHMLRKESKLLTTFTNVANDSQGIDNALCEKRYAEEVIAFNDIKNCIFLPRDMWEDPLQEVEFLLNVNDGLEKCRMMWQLPMKNAARENGVRTMLSGFPGDELVSYDGSYSFLDFLERGEYLNYLRAKSNKNGFSKIQPLLNPQLHYALHKIKNLAGIYSKVVTDAAYIVDIPLKYRMKRGDIVWNSQYFRERFTSYRHYQKYRILKSHVSLRMEAENRFGLYFKTESRFPMADVRLTQFYLSMPNEIKYEGTGGRQAFRKALGSYLPAAVHNRTDKVGSIAPFTMMPDKIKRRQTVLLNLLNELKPADPARNELIARSDKYKGLRAKYLELLVWYQKNS